MYKIIKLNFTSHHLELQVSKRFRYTTKRHVDQLDPTFIRTGANLISAPGQILTPVPGKI